MINNLLLGKTAVVTGSGRGIGEAIVRTLSKYGANVVITDIDMDTAQQVVDDLVASGANAKCLKFDVSDIESIPKIIEQIKDLFGRIDIWVNNAGITGSKSIEEITQESWDRMMSIDLKANFFCTQKVLEIMKKQKYGKIVNISSLAAKRGGRSSDASYAAAKAGILNLTKDFALHAAEYNITVNAVCPGNILTPMGKTLSWSKIDPKTYIPMRRYGIAQDVANGVLFYASDLSSYITGDSMNINGGLYM